MGITASKAPAGISQRAIPTQSAVALAVELEVTVTPFPLEIGPSDRPTLTELARRLDAFVGDPSRILTIETLEPLALAH